MNNEPILDIFNGNLSESQQSGINTIIEEWQQSPNNSDIRHLACILGNIFHETGRKMQPVKEGGNEAYLKSKKYYPYYGRGHIQLTWDYNYQKFGELLSIDLLNNPDLVLDSNISTKITLLGMQKGLFTGKKLSDYFNEITENWLWSRAIINGKRKGELLPDRAEDVSIYGKKFYEALTQ